MSSSVQENRQLIPGMPVIVTGGKLQGKQGILSSVRRWVVIVVGDQLGVEVKKSMVFEWK